MRDEWAAMPDGGVAVVRVHDYHVDRYSAAGKRTSGIQPDGNDDGAGRVPGEDAAGRIRKRDGIRCTH